MFNQKTLEDRIKFYFKNPDLCRQAFVHRSYVNEADDNLESNERLEFLGDAVLELVVTDFLYKKYPNMAEGELTPIRSALVRGKNLASVASRLNLGVHLFLSKGEDVSGGRQKEYILANATEALIGAIYVDQGYAKAQEFINSYILPETETILEQGTHLDAKSSFQEKSQELENTTPEYRLESEDGPDHSKIFTMGVYLNDQLVAKGSGTSKQKAEQEAAYNGLQIKGW